MQKTDAITILTVCMGCFVLFALVAPAVVLGTTTDFVPLAPIEGVSETGGSPENFFNGIFRLGVIVAAFLAVIVIVIGGFQYMTTEAVSGKGEAKNTITSALAGLFLILLSTLLLQIINPDILDFNLFKNSGAPINTGATEGTIGNPDTSGYAYEVILTSEGCPDNSTAGFTYIGTVPLESCPLSNPSLPPETYLCCAYAK